MFHSWAFGENLWKNDGLGLPKHKRKVALIAGRGRVASLTSRSILHSDFSSFFIIFEVLL